MKFALTVRGGTVTMVYARKKCDARVEHSQRLAITHTQTRTHTHTHTHTRQNQPEPARTGQNQPEPARTGQNRLERTHTMFALTVRGSTTTVVQARKKCDTRVEHSRGLAITRCQ